LIFTVAFGLLLDFNKRVSRGVATSSSSRERNLFASTKTLFGTLVAREASDLFLNPRARLLTAVPFVLGILLKLLSAKALVQFIAPDTADAWILTGLSLYGTLVLTSTFSQNAFAYDGHGLASLLASPIEIKDVLRAKNATHALAGLGLGTVVMVFYALYFRSGRPIDYLFSMLSILTFLPVAITVGNFLSIYFPVKFHANLKRKDRLPFVASMIGVAGASAATFPAAWILKNGPLTMNALLLLFGTALLAWTIYGASLKLTFHLLSGRKEFVLRAVTRE
jgi:ABC-2 type transport system permease protein